MASARLSVPGVAASPNSAEIRPSWSSRCSRLGWVEKQPLEAGLLAEARA